MAPHRRDNLINALGNGRLPGLTQAVGIRCERGKWSLQAMGEIGSAVTRAFDFLGAGSQQCIDLVDQWSDFVGNARCEPQVAAGTYVRNTASQDIERP
jgi:hypothetical protein